MKQSRLAKTVRSAVLHILSYGVRIILFLTRNQFDRRLDDPAKAQVKAFKKILSGVSGTEYGQSFGIGLKDSYEEFLRKIPIATYEMLSPWIKRQIETEGKVLVSEKIPFYEKTSGSSGAYKLIPYTQSHLRSFHHMFVLWFHDLLENGPKFSTAKIFTSISPYLFVQDDVGQNLKIGLEKDEEYLPGWIQILFQSFWVLPAHVSKLRFADNFKRVASLYLIAEEDLEAILIWSPSFFTNLLDYIEQNKDFLREDLSSGHITLEGLKFYFKKMSPDRIAILGKNKATVWAELWPELKLISCWDSVLANSGAHYLREIFPRTLVQGKGLLATESPMTFPLISAGGFVPLVDTIFFEFEDKNGRILRLNELSKGEEYQIIISIPGGFTRYRIGDLVRVSHYYRATPCFEFIGRAGAASDLVGEKLTEQFVQSVIQELSLTGSRFQLLVPATHKKRPYYILVVDRLFSDISACSDKLDALLQGSHRYRSARLIGQLDKAEIIVNPLAEDTYLNHFTKAGMRRGNIKHRYLFNKPFDSLINVGSYENHV